MSKMENETLIEPAYIVLSRWRRKTTGLIDCGYNLCDDLIDKLQLPLRVIFLVEI